MSNRGRKAATPTEAPQDPTNHEALARAGQALNEFAKRSTEVATQYADGVPYERERVVNEAKYLMAASAEAMLEAGKRLIQIKENEPWGDFVEIVTTRLNLEPRTAQRMMSASVKFLAPALAGQAKTFVALGKSKLFDLAFEDEGELQELAEGGTLAGHTLDQIDAMTARELKAALRKARDEVAAKDRLLEGKNKKIDQLTTEAEFRLAEPTQAMMKDLQSATIACELYLIQLANVVTKIICEDRSPLQHRAKQAVQYVLRHLAELIDENGIPVSISEGLNVRPEWLPGLQPAKAKEAANPAR